MKKYGKMTPLLFFAKYFLKPNTVVQNEARHQQQQQQ